MNSPHVVQVISQVSKSHVFEWMAAGLKEKCRLTFILLNPGGSPLEEYLKSKGITVIRIRYRGKRDFIPVLIKVYSTIRKLKPDVVHTHLLEAQLTGLIAAWWLNVPKRVYTRHTSNFHQVYHPRAVWLDRLCNRLATDIISISQATFTTLTEYESVPASKISSIPHGFDIDALTNVSAERILKVRNKWSIPDEHPVVGVISRHITWKGITYILPAFSNLQKSFPNARLILANAAGPIHEDIIRELQELSIDRYVLIPFEEDVAALYRTFDLYVHVPIDPISEAFGQTYVESLAMGVPSVFTLSGIAAEFIVHGTNAWVVPFKNSAAIGEALQKLWGDAAMCRLLTSNGKIAARKFEAGPLLNTLLKLYERKPGK